MTGVYNPCLPGGSSLLFRSNVQISKDGMETLRNEKMSDSEFYEAIITNEEERSNYDQCNSLVHQLLHMEQNAWCNFDHKGDCSFAGIYQPKLPPQSDSFGEFIAFSNYVRIWDFLNLPERSSIAELEHATKDACNLSKNETLSFNNGRIDEDEVEQYCFRSVYALNILRGYGFRDNDHITAKNVINGHKVAWALGAMLYEINTLPWAYDAPKNIQHVVPSFDGFDYGGSDWNWMKWEGFAVLLLVAFAGVLWLQRRRASSYLEYEPVKDVSYQHQPGQNV